MMQVDVVRLPDDLEPRHLDGRAVVVFDVLRATTTIVSALAAGAREVRIFSALDEARHAAAAGESARLLCGERDCLPPPGFDLGNSPGDFTAARVAGKTIFMCTTNGTRAIVAASGAARLFAGALLNASAVAKALVLLGIDVTLLCAGTRGTIAPEDLIGAGAVLDALQRQTAVQLASEPAREALHLFLESRSNLPVILRTTEGGGNIIAADLARDIDFAAKLDVFDVVAEITGRPPVARNWLCLESLNPR